jgi:hypothetical protein
LLLFGVTKNYMDRQVWRPQNHVARSGLERDRISNLVSAFQAAYAIGMLRSDGWIAWGAGRLRDCWFSEPASMGHAIEFARQPGRAPRAGFWKRSLSRKHQGRGRLVSKEGASTRHGNFQPEPAPVLATPLVVPWITIHRAGAGRSDPGGLGIAVFSLLLTASRKKSR